MEVIVFDKMIVDAILKQTVGPIGSAGEFSTDLFLKELLKPFAAFVFIFIGNVRSRHSSTSKSLREKGSLARPFT